MNRFDRLAQDYDTHGRAERAAVIAEKIRSKIIGEKDIAAMEFGCGTGLVGLQLMDCFASITFIDSSEGMIERVKQKIINNNNSNLYAKCIDLLSDRSFDYKFSCIFTSLALHHIVDTPAILMRLYGLLNTGGHLFVVDLDADNGDFHLDQPNYGGHNGFDQHELRGIAKAVGFITVCVETFYNGIKETCGIKHPYSLFIMDAGK